MEEKELGFGGVPTLELEYTVVQRDHVAVHRSHDRGKTTLMIGMIPTCVVAGAVVVTDESRWPA